jgi:hypothetical protein
MSAHPTFWHVPTSHRNLLLSHFLIIFLFFLVFSSVSSAQVALYPFTKSQFFDNNGRPCVGCKLFSYSAGTTTPLLTYRDSAGVIPNTNPIVMDAAGRADVWMTPVAYKFIMQTSAGVTLWSEDNISSANNTLLGLNNIWTGQNTWNNTAIFNSSVTFNSGFTSSGPNNMSGGGILDGTFTGTPVFSGVPSFSNGFSSTTGTFSGQITSTLATGTPPFVISSTTQVNNLNAGLLNGCTWAIPCPLGSTTPNTASVTTLLANSFTLAGGTPQVATQGSDNHLMTAGMITGGAGTNVCLDANSGLTTLSCSIGASKIQAVTYCAVGCVVTGTPCTTGGSTFDTCDNSIAWPVVFADANYSVTCSGVTAVDGGNPTTGRANLQIASQNTVSVAVRTVTVGSSPIHWTQINCTGVHP